MRQEALENEIKREKEQHAFDEKKSSAAQLEELKTAKRTDVAQAVQSVVENLRGEATQVATQIGIDALIAAVGSGADKLLGKMKE